MTDKKIISDIKRIVKDHGRCHITIRRNCYEEVDERYQWVFVKGVEHIRPVCGYFLENEDYNLTILSQSAIHLTARITKS